MRSIMLIGFSLLAMLPALGDAVNAAVRSSKLRPAYWQTMRSSAAAMPALFAQPVSADESHRDVPLVILTATDANARATPEQRKVLDAARDATHDALARTSTRGRRIDIEHTSHDIQLDNPGILRDVIEQLVSPPDAE